MPPVHYHEGRFPPDNLDWDRLIPLLGPAASAISLYNGMLTAIPNSHVLLSPLTTQEAVMSSRIEGTQATIGEVLEYEAGDDDIVGEKREDILEIINYRSAMFQAEAELAKLPLSLRVIRSAHTVLLDGVRGENKSPGEYRTVQNWIGPQGCSIDEAHFIPIPAGDPLKDALSRWEKYLHGAEKDKLVQLGILHAEFESLHPFYDGNGRMGRMLVPLFLWQQGLLQQPTFYISRYFEARRGVYYERLLSVSRDDDWTGWCEFFLKAIVAQAEDNVSKTRDILALYDDLKYRFADVTHSSQSIAALDWIMKRPIFRSTDFYKASGIPSDTARNILRLLRTEGILNENVPGSGRRPAIFSLPSLLDIVERESKF